MNQSGHRPASVRFRRAFSLVEILVTVALLSVIILGLVAMFNQTRRAFTSSITQVDVLEAGRTTADLVAREMEQMAAAGSYSAVNFYVDTPVGAAPMTQSLLDPTDIRTNSMQEVFFLTRLNQTWTGIGYKILPPVGAGTLYRYSGNGIVASNGLLIRQQWTNFFNAISNVTGISTNLTRIMDGVVDFRIHAYDTNGNILIRTNLSTLIFNTNSLTADYSYNLSSNSLPGYVEIELGVLEDRTLARYQALLSSDPFGTAANAYLTNHPGQVHIFRQRIPIRNVNSAGYQ